MEQTLSMAAHGVFKIAKMRQRLIEIAEKCPVHKTLTAGARITTKEAGR